MISKGEAEVICNEHYDYVRRFCLSRLRKKEDAEDIAQDTFLLFLEKREIIEDKYIETWLITVATYKIMNEFAKRKKALARYADYDKEMEYFAKKSESLQSSIVSVYAEKYINKAYEGLTDKEKRLFDLLADGLKKEGEIAKELEISSHACYMRKSRLIETVSEKLREILFY